MFNDPILMIFISKLSGEPQDLILKGNITTSTLTENLHFYCMQIRSHDQQIIFFLNAAIDLQMNLHSSTEHKYCISTILAFSRKHSMIRVKMVIDIFCKYNEYLAHSNQKNDESLGYIHGIHSNSHRYSRMYQSPMIY